MKNQCDGCNAGIPIVNGSHRMGREGGYPDLMGCTAKLYAADPDREEFENHPRFKGMDFTRSANPEYYESPYANGALDGWRAKAASQFTAVDMTTAAADGFRDGAASHWQAMETCPKHVDVLFFHERNGVIAGRLTDADSFMTDKERDEFEGGDEAQFCIDAFGFGHWGVDRMDGSETPTHWMPFPPETEVKP